MIRYKSSNQLPIAEFALPFEGKLNSENRWVKLSKIIPWDELAGIYYKSMSTSKGSPGKDARIVIGAIIIKHKEKLSDEGAILAIQENPFMQYFLGLSGFTQKIVFDPSLFVSIRKRLGAESFDKMTQEIIKIAIGSKINKVNKPVKSKEINSTKQGDKPIEADLEEKTEKKNRGKLKLDATVADAYIKYPTDLELLSDSRKKSEEMIDYLYRIMELKIKPRTYRRKARKQFLLIAKKKNKSKKEIRRGIRQQLGFLKRDMKILYKMLDKCPNKRIPLTKQMYKYFLVIQEVYRQQQEMYNNNEHSCQDRIVSIHQPHVRPIVRGKAKTNVEFGAKIGVSLNDGYCRIDTFSWDAYNEGTDLKKQCENYKELLGYYPELVQVDRIYLNRENRSWLKYRNIRTTGKPLGRPVKEELSDYQKRKRKKETAERNHIEGKFGQGKNGYDLNKIRARLDNTSESWISSIFFMMNLVRLFKDFLFAQFLKWLKRGLSYTRSIEGMFIYLMDPLLYPLKIMVSFGSTNLCLIAKSDS